MKKLIALILASAMTLSMTACSNGNTVQTESLSELPQQAADGEVVYVSESEIDDIIAGIQPQVMETADDYEAVLESMGFVEVDLDIHRILKMDGTAGDPTTTVKNIIYKDGVFRMELSAYDQEFNTTTDGWVLYGTKATEIADISGLDPKACDCYYVLNYADEFDEYKGISSQYIDYEYLNGGEEYSTVKAVFFTETGNLYNMVKTFEKLPEEGFAAPRVIWRREQLAD